MLNGKRGVAWFGLLHAILLTIFLASLGHSYLLFASIHNISGGSLLLPQGISKVPRGQWHLGTEFNLVREYRWCYHGIEKRAFSTRTVAVSPGLGVCHAMNGSLLY